MGFAGTVIDEEDDDEPREYGLWWGFVTNNGDPEGRGRSRIKIPGLNNLESTWAEPVGMLGAGGGKHGAFAVPKVGANVLIGFIQGDIDHPVYWGGPPPRAAIPTNAKPDNVVFESDDFRVSFIEDKGSKRLRMETILPNVAPAQQEAARSFIEIAINAGDQGQGHVINIRAASALTIRSAGSIDIDAPVVNIKGRSVSPTPTGI